MKNIAAFLEGADAGELRLLLAAVERKLRHGAPAEFGELGEGDARHLDAGQLARLTDSVQAWREAAGTPTQRRSRARVWLAYLLLRYGGLRLGEVLALDDRADFNFSGGLVRVGGPAGRAVQMPEDVMRGIAALLEDPMFYSLRGEVLRIDPGYLRRKFYEQAELADLPRELVNPRVLRHSRGLELLHGGVPPAAVRFYLGQPGRGQNGGLGDLSPRTGQRIVQQYLAREIRMKTSARNLFMGQVTRIAQDGLLAEVELATLSGLRIVAMITQESLDNLRIAEGGVATASVKAPWVVLAAPEQDAPVRSSARNQFAGKVARVNAGKLAAEVLVDLYEGSKVCALVTEGSVEQLGLGPGSDVVVMFKAFSVILSVD